MEDPNTKTLTTIYLKNEDRIKKTKNIGKNFDLVDGWKLPMLQNSREMINKAYLVP